MRVWEKIDTFQEERGSWNGWLTSLTRHAALNHARRISRHGGAEALSEDPHSPELTPEEVLTAVTLNGAAAIGMADKVGSVEAGKQADLVIWDAPDLDYICYRIGSNLADIVIKKGNIVAKNR